MGMAQFKVQSVSLLERFEALPTCLSHNNSIKMKSDMEDWWKDTDRRKPNARSKSCPSVTTSIYKYTMMYQSNTTKLYYVYYCIGVTCFDSYRIIFRPF